MTARSMLRRAAAGLFSAGLLAALAGPAFAGTPDPAISPAWPQDTVLGYGFVSSAMPPAAMRTAIVNGAADANASRASRAPSFAFGTPGNGVSYGVSTPCGTNGLACFQRSPASGYWHLWYRENGHRFDWGTLSWCEMTGTPNGCFLAETITIDELGHVAGLDHHANLADGSDYLDAVVQAYSHARPDVGWSASAFGPCDVATLQQVYGPADWFTRYSPCLDIPTTLGLSGSPTSTTTTGPVKFTAILRTAGVGPLAANPMSGRSVVLQQRSGTAWADLTSMTPTASAGTYSVSLTLKGSQVFRAVFRKPPNEGVRTSTSGTVSISVQCTTAPCPLALGTAQP